MIGAVIDPKEIVGARVVDAKVSDFGVIYLRLEKGGRVFTVAVDTFMGCSTWLVLLDEDDYVWSEGGEE